MNKLIKKMKIILLASLVIATTAQMMNESL